jgi:ethanolamine-phosphate phospho-lyase
LVCASDCHNPFHYRLQGEGSYLIDESHQTYLDTRNNVAHVGHCHPRVVAAVQKQVAEINTNTRYLHPNMAKLGQRLADLLPEPLNVVFFCNSGSEANDLALRLARAYSGGSSNTIVVDGAYHGHTLGVLEVSPYKYESGTEYEHVRSAYNGSRSSSPGKHIWKVPCPDTFRGEFKDKSTAGSMYARHVADACEYYTQNGELVRAFIVEGGMSVAGVILPPSNYLAESAKAVRQAGGLYIADEVQTGLGRLGSCFWAFQYNDSPEDPDVIPDIVTIGKPLGNGMPLAALVTTRAVADHFDQCGVEYFNTFAGNPVCAAAGLAVLDVLEADNLQDHARVVGDYLKTKLLELGTRLDLIGDVRGSGLFIGVELIRNRATSQPATAETSFICSVLKSKFRVLTSIDGPNDNVLVIKPPMVFSRQNADYLVESFEAAARDNELVGHIGSFIKTST